MYSTVRSIFVWTLYGSPRWMSSVLLLLYLFGTTASMVLCANTLLNITLIGLSAKMPTMALSWSFYGRFIGFLDRVVSLSRFVPISPSSADSTYREVIQTPRTLFN